MDQSFEHQLGATEVLAKCRQRGTRIILPQHQEPKVLSTELEQRKLTVKLKPTLRFIRGRSRFWKTPVPGHVCSNGIRYFTAIHPKSTTMQRKARYLGGVDPDSIQLDLPRRVQQVEISLCGRLASASVIKNSFIPSMNQITLSAIVLCPAQTEDTWPVRFRCLSNAIKQLQTSLSFGCLFVCVRVCMYVCVCVFQQSQTNSISFVLMFSQQTRQLTQMTGTKAPNRHTYMCSLWCSMILYSMSRVCCGSSFNWER